MKKLVHLLLCLVLALAACSRPEPVTEPETPPGGGNTTKPEDTSILPVWESGSKYRIVYHDGEDDNLAYTCANEIADALRSARKTTLKVVSDKTDTSTSEYEISVGTTSRKAVTDYLASEHDTFDYLVCASGRRLIVTGASGWSLKAATQKLLSEYILPGKAIPSDLKVTGNCRGQYLFPLESGANLRLLDNNIWSYNEEVIPAAWAALKADPRNSFRCKQYAAMVKALLPDVFAWQEYAQAMQDRVEPLIADKYTEVLPYGKEGIRNATPLFYNKETVELLEADYLLFPGEFNNSASKSYTAAVFRHKATSARFIVVGTHLWYQTESAKPGSNEARTAQALLIANKVENLLIEYDCPVYVMGDMNCKLDSDAMRIFTSRGYKDCGLSATVYKDSFKGHHTCSETAGFSWTPQANDNCATAIDHIFEYNGTNKAKVLSHRIITAQFTLCLTDHCPRYVDICLEREGSGSQPTGDKIQLADAGTRILFIGNSFTKDAVEHLPGIIAASGYKDITLAHLYHGGRTIPAYNDWTLADYTLYKAEKGASSWTSHGTQVAIDQVASGGRWDIITIQEHTGNYLAWSWSAEEKQAIEGLVSKLKATQKTPPVFYYILSQAYYDMNKIASASKGYITWTDQAGMWNVLTEQARKVIDQTEMKDVISTGGALQNLRTSGLDTPLNLTRDGYHMDYGTARYAAACTVYGKLVEPITHISLDNNSYRFNKSDFSLGNYTSPVTDETAPVCRKAARYALEKPYDVTDMNGEGGQGGGGTAYPFKGSGTEADPFLIEKAEDMQGISSALELGKTRHFRMTADIDMGSITDWTPVVAENKAYGIHFDGNRHIISNFTCKDKPFASLFGVIYGEVHDLTLKDCSVSSTEACALLAAWGGTATSVMPTRVKGVHAVNGSVTMTSTTAVPVGGLIANACDLTLLDSSFQGTVTCKASSGSLYLGGLVGKIALAGVKISRCHADVQIKGTGGSKVGGLVGSSYTGCSVLITDCYTTGAITGKCSYMGGIIGDVVSGTTVLRCYSTMDLTGGYNHGGIVGRASNLANPNTTGTFESLLNITVSDCIAWNGSIRTSGSGEKPASHYSSGAVVGFSVYRNTLQNCWRKPDMVFNVYANTEYNKLKDNDNVSPTSPLVKPSQDLYHCPYNGKAAPAGATVSSLAADLGWSRTVWDFSSPLPVLTEQP